MKILITIILLSVNIFSQSTGSVLSEARSYLHHHKVVYFTKIEQRGNTWFEVVDKLFIKKGAKLSKSFKKKLKNPKQIYMRVFQGGESRKKDRYIVYVRSNGLGFPKPIGLYQVTEDMYLKLLEDNKFHEHQTIPN